VSGWRSLISKFAVGNQIPRAVSCAAAKFVSRSTFVPSLVGYAENPPAATTLGVSEFMFV
jgi:hypothetical protein